MSETNGNREPVLDREIFTKAQKVLLDVLADGLPHLRSELHKACCGPSSRGALRILVFRTRKHLRPLGQDIICELRNHHVHYRHVRLIGSSHRE